MPAPLAHPVAHLQSLYAAFGRGDIATILAALHDQVDWRINVDLSAPGAAAVPTFKPRRGPREVGLFFADLTAAVEIHSFQPTSFLAGDGDAAVHIEMEFTVRHNGRRLKMEAMHYHKFDAAGKIVRFVDFLDTLGDAAAWGSVK